MAALLLLVSAAAAASLGELTRRDTGDVFTLLGGECGASRCAEHGAGAARAASGCACACPQRAPLFREDRELCVDDLPECSLATFGTGMGVQRIPFVYLPLKGQIIHPSREIIFQNVKTPICAVSGAQFLTRKGFLDLRNTLDADVPFSLFRDEGRTFLQWSGEDELRTRMSGRVMVVRLLCRDISATPTSPLDLRGVFTPCVAFRVQGTPPKHGNNITEVQFALNAHTSEVSNTSGLTVTEYIAIGISSLLLGLIYVASVFLYLHIKKRRKAASEESSLKKLKNLKLKDGSSIKEHDIIRISNERIQSLTNQDDGVIKKNPLLTVGRQFHDNKGFCSELSDLEDFADSSVRSEENNFNKQTTSAVIHRNSKEIRHQGDGYEMSHRDESGIERLPDEHVSIVETIDDREIARPVGTTRRKLYFNPAYFEPHLMADPPAAAIEFLSKIREVMAIAKQKMASKRFHPVLNGIPEEETYASNSIDLYNAFGSQRSGSVISLKRNNSRKRSSNCLGCPGCKSSNSNDIQTFIKYNVTTCNNCIGDKGEKQNSIRKWLENIPNTKSQIFYNDHAPNQIKTNLANSLLSLPKIENQCKLHKTNSFSASHSRNIDNFSNKQSTSRSVRSEPSVRNYNIPLPDFDNVDTLSNHCETVSKEDDITPIGLNDSRSGSLSSNMDHTKPNKHSLIKNNTSLPDMVNEAIALDHFSRSSYNMSSSDEEKFSKNSESKQNENSFERNVLDSPSGNEYETDSLERNSNKKGKVTPVEYPDVPSSQASPSLSNALPLEEELSVRNAIYKTNSSSNSNTPSPLGDICIGDNHYETIELKKSVSPVESTTNVALKHNNNYNLVSEVYVNNNYNFDSTPTSPSGSECSMGSRKLNLLHSIDEKPGCLTIEVKDPPENYIKIHESDGFEPDTLDRKYPKQREIIENIQFSRKDLLKNIDVSERRNSQRIQLRSSGTFVKNDGKNESMPRFNSLRNDHEHPRHFLNRPKLSPTVCSGSKSLEGTTDDACDDNADDWSSEEGRILTLELRHSKRQRQSTPPTIKQLKNLARPDILPPLPPTEDSPIYEKPKIPPRKVQCDNTSIPYPIISQNRNLSPRTKITNMMTESVVCDNLSSSSSICPSSRNPIRASIRSQYSKYEDVNAHQEEIGFDNSRNSTRTSSSHSRINTNTFVRGQKGENVHRTKFRRKKGPNVEDSGYLSSDSTSSKQVQRKLVITKIVSCTESDDTEDEARSESGAESVETHSVYFGNCQKMQQSEENTRNSNKMITDNKKTINASCENISQ
ncbi:unnamed protein product, partial [Brenthis ino]